MNRLLILILFFPRLKSRIDKLTHDFSRGIPSAHSARTDLSVFLSIAHLVKPIEMNTLIVKKQRIITWQPTVVLASIKT